MSLAVSRRCFTAGGLTLALVLSSPLAALADPADRGSETSRSARSEARPSPTPSAPPVTDDQRRTRQAAEPKDAETAREQPQDERPKGERRGQARRAGTARATTGAQPTGDRDPRGNNGTITIDGAPFDDSKGNEPHVGCDVRLVFWGFDAGDTASITFTGQAPTGGGLLHSETGTLISRDAAGGGQDLDEALVYSLGGALSELTSIAPHPQQGWHVKVAVDVDSAPGGAKQKVFWMSCPATAAAGTGTTAAPSASPVTLGAAGVDVGGTTVTTPRVGAQRGAPAPAAAELTLGAGTLEVTQQSAVTATSPAAANAGGAASARTADRPSALPFTGPAALGLLIAVGLGALGAGGLAHRLGRRRDVLTSA